MYGIWQGQNLNSDYDYVNHGAGADYLWSLSTSSTEL